MLPAVGIFGVVVGWIVKKVGMKALITGLQITMTSAAIVASISALGIAVSLVVLVFNRYSEFSNAATAVTSSSNIAIQVASASGVLSALFDLFSVFIPMIVLFLTYKLALFTRQMAWKFSKAVFEIGMQVQS